MFRVSRAIESSGAFDEGCRDRSKALGPSMRGVEIDLASVGALDRSRYPSARDKGSVIRDQGSVKSDQGSVKSDGGGIRDKG